MKRFGKLLVVALGAMLVLGTTFGLAGCGGKTEEEIAQEQVDACLDKIKSVDEATVEAMVGEGTSADLKKYDIEPADFYKALFGKFDYVDNGVELDGDTGTVKLTVTYLDIDSAVMTLTDDVFGYLASDEIETDIAEKGESYALNHIFSIIVDDLNGIETKTHDVEPPISKDKDGNWGIDLTDEKVVKSLLGGEDIERVFNLTGMLQI